MENVLYEEIILFCDFLLLVLGMKEVRCEYEVSVEERVYYKINDF